MDFQSITCQKLIILLCFVKVVRQKHFSSSSGYGLAELIIDCSNRLCPLCLSVKQGVTYCNHWAMRLLVVIFFIYLKINSHVYC